MRSRDVIYFSEEIRLTDVFTKMTIYHWRHSRMLFAGLIQTTMELTARGSTPELNALGKDNRLFIYNRWWWHLFLF